MSGPPTAADRDFTSIAEGESAEFMVAPTAEDLDIFAHLSGDFNPRHMQAVPPFRRRLVHGALLTSYFSRLVGMLLPGRRCIYLSQQTEFLRPAFAGEELLVRGEVVRRDAVYRRLDLKTTISRRGQLVASGIAQVLLIDLATEVIMELKGRRAVVTGGSRGIGAACARMLVGAGARVVVSYRARRDDAEHEVEAARGLGGEMHALPLDLGDGGSVGRFVEDAFSKLGGIDILVNNAAPPLVRKPALEIEWPVLREQFEQIVGGTLACTQAVARHMVAARSGTIVNLLTGALLGAPPSGLGSYVAVKSALAALTRSLAVELGPKGVRVNAVSPGLTDTEMTADIPQMMKNRLGGALPLTRTAQPDDVAAVVLFLCSDASRYLTGVNLPVVGGGWML